VLSKKQAALRANALLKSARGERESAAVRSTRFLVFLFPGLSTCAASKRRSFVQTARQRASRRKHVSIANYAVLVPGIAWMVALAAGWDGASSLLWIALSIMVVGQLLQHLQTRVELRVILDSQTSSIHDVDGSDE
jgi:hypothetical protein